MKKIGDKINTEIIIKTQSGEDFKISNILGKYTVLYFYPKDDTPGCTIEACEFSNFNEKIEALGAVVYGISADDMNSHKKFRDKHAITINLLSDEKRELMKDFGVLDDGSLIGKIFNGIIRSTFIIDPEGNIVHVWEKVTQAEGHAKEVYDELIRISAHQ